MNTKLTAYEILEQIANIADPIERKNTLRTVLSNNNALAIVVQRTYHPDYKFDIPEGPLPAEIAKKSGHDEPGPFLQSLRRWYTCLDNFQLPKHKKEAHFIDIYESVASKDADLLIAVKDKKLPWETLDAAFVVDAVPELFPSSFRDQVSGYVAPPADQTAPTSVPAVKPESKPVANSGGKSKKQICKEIMQANPGLARKDYIALFEAQGVSKSTAGLYYQQLKDEV